MQGGRYHAAVSHAPEECDCGCWDAEAWTEEEALELGVEGGEEEEAEEEAEEVGVEEDFAPVSAVEGVGLLWVGC